MDMRLEKVTPFYHGAELGPDCLCPPVCFQCPPPFCLPCGPGPNGSPLEGAEECMPQPRQCGPFLMLNTPMERKMILLPAMDRHNNRPNTSHYNHNHGGHHDLEADCCDDSHHHHHGTRDDQECCEKSHHHHHHEYDSDCDERSRHQRGRNHSREKKPKRHHRGSDDEFEESRGGMRNRERQNESREKDENPKDQKRKTKRPRTNSRELRGGKLYIGCDCEKKNGLQDECQRSDCQGSPECVTNPPTCAPSAYSSGKHLTKRREEFEKKIREQFKYC